MRARLAGPVERGIIPSAMKNSEPHLSIVAGAAASEFMTWV
jgi:hypothetical protein